MSLADVLPSTCLLRKSPDPNMHLLMYQCILRPHWVYFTLAVVTGQLSANVCAKFLLPQRLHASIRNGASSVIGSPLKWNIQR